MTARHANPSLRTYAATLVALVLVVIGLFSWLVYDRVVTLDRQAAERNAGLAREELLLTLEEVMAHATQLAQSFGQWDETIQQFGNPTYYDYWRERRVGETHLAPAYFDGIELYNDQGLPLGGETAVGMPEKVSGSSASWQAVRDEREGHAHLYYVNPLLQPKGEGWLRGYLVLKLDLTEAIASVQHFRYVDPGSVNVTGPVGMTVSGDQLLGHLAYKLQSNWEFDQLEGILLGALWQFAGLATALLLLSLYLLFSLGSMPLARLSQHIDLLGRGGGRVAGHGKRLLPLAEFDKVRSSLNDYHTRLSEGARALQESETRMRAVLHNVVDGILTFNHEGGITSANPAVQRLFGWPVQELLGRHIASLFANLAPGEIQRLATHVDTDSGDAPAARRIELVGKDRDAIEFPVELTLSRLQLPDGESFIAVVEDISDRKAAEQRLLYMANYDALTGLPNRALLRDRLQHAMLQAERADLLVGVLFLDLDRFKTINDTLGHHSGDQLLNVVADRLKRCVRSSDTVARLGGDEFMVVVEGMHHVDEASIVAKQIRAAFDEPIQLRNREVFVTPSIGITLYPLDDSDADALLRNADSAMYRAKALGGDGIQFFTQDLNDQAAERLSLESSLRQALARDEFELHYQPRIDLPTNRVVGTEALLRWRHPEHGLVPPDRFIGILEEIGLIEPVGDWVLRTACEQAMAWVNKGLPPMRVAVNISPRQFRNKGLADEVEKVLGETGLAPEWLELEVTESLLVENVEATRLTLQALSDRGVHIALDDFGTGYSALGYLRHFPIDTMKIDRSYITDVPFNEDDARLASALVAIARSLGLQVTAEGVETTAQLEFLAGLGCQEVQGFLYSRPLPASEFEAWLAAGPVPTAYLHQA